MRASVFYAVLGALVLTLAGGCGDDGGGTTPGADGGMATAQLRVWHLAPEAGNVDVFINGTRALMDVGFEQNSAYAPVAAGSTDIAVAPTGAGMAGALIRVMGLNLPANTRWTIIAWRTSPTDPQAVAALAVQEEAAPPSAGNIKLRAFHVSYAVTGAVDVHNVDGMDNPEVVMSLEQGRAAPSALDLPNAAYRLGIDTDRDGTIDLQTAMPLDMPPAGARLLVGVLSKPGEMAGETETEVVFLVNDGANIHDEVELEPF